VNYFLDERDDRFNYWKQRRQEKEAEVFAAYLLIPEDKLNEKLKEEWVKESPDPIPELAEEFQVSENFMKKRLKLKIKSTLLNLTGGFTGGIDYEE
jgi:Zn-dependent peptidase ImmA (M78 family)